MATVTGWTADEWASSSPPETAETTIPQGLPCTRLANLILAPKEEAQRIAGYVPRWGAQLTSNWSESRAWATYRALQKQYASLIGDREPIVLHGRLPGMDRRLALSSASATTIAPIWRNCAPSSSPPAGLASCCGTASGAGRALSFRKPRTGFAGQGPRC